METDSSGLLAMAALPCLGVSARSPEPLDARSKRIVCRTELRCKVKSADRNAVIAGHRRFSTLLAGLDRAPAPKQRSRWSRFVTGVWAADRYH